MFTNEQLTLLTEGQVWGNMYEDQLEVLKKYGTRSAISDLVILTGGYCEDTCTYMVPDDNSLKGRVGWTYTQSSDGDGDIYCVDRRGNRAFEYRYLRTGAVRPILSSSFVFSQIYPNSVMGYNNTKEVEYGEYPQYAPDKITQRKLESEFQNRRLQLTGKNYTFDGTVYNNCSQGFQATTYDEYKYNGRKYIRVIANSDYRSDRFKLSNGEEYRNGDYVWVEISPVKWLIDDRTKILVSKIGLLSGIRFHSDQTEYDGDFSATEMREYLDKYMSKDLLQNVTLTTSVDMISEEKKQIEEVKKQEEKRRNPYEFNFGQEIGRAHV